jgi:hypothetical protein
MSLTRLFIVTLAILSASFSVFLYSLLEDNTQPDSSAPISTPDTQSPSVRPESGNVTRQPAVSSPVSETRSDTGRSRQTANESSRAETGQWAGRIKYVWGRFGPPTEVHLRVQNISGDEVDAFFVDEAEQWGHLVAHEMLPFLTAQEAAERDGGTVADDVIVTGVVANADAVRFRVTSRSAPLVELKSIERIGEPASRVTVERVRQAGKPLDYSPADTLRAILRIPAPPGPALTFRGHYRKPESRAETIVVSPGKDSNRGVEVRFTGTDFSRFRAGDLIEVTAAPTKFLYRRVIDGTLYKRLVLIGKNIAGPLPRDTAAGDNLSATAARNHRMPGFPQQATSLANAVITGYGRYTNESAGSIDSVETSGGTILLSTGAHHIETTKTIPCRIGENWGFYFQLHNLPQDRAFAYRSEMLHPPIRQPDGSMLTKTVIRLSVAPGNAPPDGEFWSFIKGYEYELVPGEWTRKIFVDDVEVASMTFDVVELGSGH